jgi:two-component sensor histidine kinase
LAIEDVTERRQLERERSLAHKRTETLLLELTHRVKNGLQTIASIVRLEAGGHKSGRGKQALEQVSERISAVGRLYANLEKTGTIEEIDAAIYLEEVCANLAASVLQEPGRAISLRTDLTSEVMSTARMILIGLIVNELVMNAIKYAFPSGTGGSVIVGLRRESGELHLTVADDGIGIEPPPSQSGIGGRLIESFARQLGGRIEGVRSSQGTIVRLILPLADGS